MQIALLEQDVPTAADYRRTKEALIAILMDEGLTKHRVAASDRLREAILRAIDACADCLALVATIQQREPDAPALGPGQEADRTAAQLMLLREQRHARDVLRARLEHIIVLTRGVELRNTGIEAV